MTPIFYIVISVLLNVCGQLSLKIGAEKLAKIHSPGMHVSALLLKAFTDAPLMAGLGLYAVSSVFWIMALSRTQLSYAYPFLSLGYVLVIVASYFILHEPITICRLAGIGCIIAGLLFIAHK